MDTPTIYDVSRLSGVSAATVSRAFTAPDRVREETRRKVLAAAEALGYQPSAIARAMARQQTDKIAFLICKKDATILDEFYASICEGVMRRANSTSYQLLISTAADWQRTGQSKQIEGVILAGDAEPSLISSFQRQGVAVVLVNHRASGFELPSVVADEQNGARQVIDHLTAYGHRRIALLAGRFSSYITSVRYNAAAKKLLVANGKGMTSRANPQGPTPYNRPQWGSVYQYIGSILQGTVAVIEVPTPEKMAECMAELGF